MADEEQKSNAFKEWYNKNKETISERRRNRYKNDPEYAEAIKRKQREYRKVKPPRSRAGQARTKVVDGVEVEVFRIGEVAQRIGRDEQTIRGWEEKGVIPRPSVPGVHRNYTNVQIELMAELASIIDQNRYAHEKLAEAIEAKSKQIHQQWKD